MIELFLLLIGARVVQRKWWILFSFGFAWMLLGFVIFGDALTDDRIPSIYFIIPLMIDAAISLLAAVGTSGTVRSLRIGKAVLFTSIVLVVVEAPWHEDMIVGILSGSFDGGRARSGHRHRPCLDPDRGAGASWLSPIHRGVQRTGRAVARPCRTRCVARHLYQPLPGGRDQP